MAQAWSFQHSSPLSRRRTPCTRHEDKSHAGKQEAGRAADMVDHSAAGIETEWPLYIRSCLRSRAAPNVGSGSIFACRQADEPPFSS